MYKRAIVIIILALLTLPSGCETNDKTTGFRSDIQNVILIVIDTLAANNLSFMGYDRKTSPFQDRLAERSVVFNRAYTPRALTLPSFASLFSGIHTIRNKVRENWEDVPNDLHLLPEEFQKAGFITAGITAAKPIASKYGISGGFDYYLDTSEPQIHASEVVSLVADFLDAEPEERTVSWSGTDKPLFLFVHFFDPHTPYSPDPDVLAEFADPDYNGRVDGSLEVFKQHNTYEIEFNEQDIQHTRDLYDAEIRTLDDYIKELFDLLDEKGLMQNSLIIITADHGENLNEHHAIGHGQPYEIGLHIPLIFLFPNDLGAGTRIDATVQNMDILPTAMDIIGIPIPEGIDGGSLLPFIEDPSNKENRIRDYALACGFYNSENDQGVYSIFNGRYRLLKDIGWSETSLLYDVIVDPHEENDLASENPELVQYLEDIITVMAAGFEPPDITEIDPERREMLESLGYIN